jgi:hypothetical protein
MLRRTYITSRTVPNLAAYLLSKQYISRNHSARTKYFLVLDSIGFENLKQIEIQFNSEKVHTQQTKRNMKCVTLNLEKV